MKNEGTDWGYRSKVRLMQHLRKWHYESLLNSAYLWSRARLATNEIQKYFSLPVAKLLKIWFLILVSTKEQTRDKSEFVTEFLGIIVTIIFVQNLSQIP